MKNALGPATTLQGTVAPFLCHPACPGVPWERADLPRRAVGPERTRISCLAPLDKTACAPFFKEGRILFASATNFYRKSGGAERRDLCVDASSWKCFSTERTRI